MIRTILRKIKNGVKSIFSPVKRKAVKNELNEYKINAKKLKKSVNKFEKKILKINPRFMPKVDQVKRYADEKTATNINLKVNALALAGFSGAQIAGYLKSQNRELKKNKKDTDELIKRVEIVEQTLTDKPKKSVNTQKAIKDKINKKIDKAILKGEVDQLDLAKGFLQELFPDNPDLQQDILETNKDQMEASKQSKSKTTKKKAKKMDDALENGGYGTSFIWDYEISSEELYQYYYHGTEALADFLRTEYDENLTDHEINGRIARIEGWL